MKNMEDNSQKLSENNSTYLEESGQHSIYNEFMSKLSKLPNIKIKKDESNKKPSKNMSEIVNNLSKCGLIVKKVPNETNAIEEIDDESEYEIEALDDDLDYIPSLKKSKKSADTKNKSDIPNKKQQNSSKFIKIQSTNYLCVMCNEKFATFDLLNQHMKNTAPCRIVVVQCPTCGKEFPSKSRCSAHMVTHKEKPKYPCTRCNRQFSNNISLQIHKEMSHTDYFDATENGFQCKMCEHHADNRVHIMHHINQKHYHVSTLLCDLCGKSFYKESGLRAHIETHRDTKPYECPICSKRFKMKSALRAHIKTHNHERRYICDECGKTFKKNSTLTEHKKYHAGDFSFPCNWCSKKFVSKSLLNTHMKNHSA